jgi:hypothetical protein
MAALDFLSMPDLAALVILTRLCFFAMSLLPYFLGNRSIRP